MCEYCKDMRNSDDVANVIIDSREIGDIMGREMSLLLGMNCYEHGETGEYQIFAMFDMQGADLDAVMSAKIKYCPFCGRKLKKD